MILNDKKALLNKVPRKNNFLCLIGLVSILAMVLFFSIILALDISQSGSGPIIKTVSDLVHGSHGWLQNLAFTLAALGLSTFILKLRLFTRKRAGSTAATSLFGITGAGFLLLPAFPSQPPGLELPVQAAIHNSIAGIISASFILGCIVLAVHFKNDPRWKSLWAYTAATVLMCLAFAMLWALMPRELQMEGLGERLLLVSGFTWVAVVSVKLIKMCRQTSGSA